MSVLHVDPAAWVICATGAAGYAVGLRRLRAKGRRWPAWRTAALGAGLVTVLVATTSPVALQAATDPTRQAVSHSLLLLVAPLLLVWGAPQALAAAASSPATSRRIHRIASGRALRVLTFPPVAVGVLFAGIAAIHLTSLHTLAGRHEALGELLQVVLLASGCTYFLPVFGTDPCPRRLREVAALVYLLLLLPFFTLFGMAVESVGAAGTLATSGSVQAADAVGQNVASAGGVLWTVGGLGSIVLTILALVRWLRIEERATPGRGSGLDEAAHAQLVAWREQRLTAAAEDADRRRAVAARRDAVAARRSAGG